MIPRIPKDEVLKFLRKKQESDGGYTGRDITELAELLQVTSTFIAAKISESDTLLNIFYNFTVRLEQL